MSIIVVLASLLLPAIHSTRERTDRVQCLDNHRQMLLAWSLFANDHQGTLPANGYTPAGGSPADLRWVQGYLNPRVAADDLSNERLLTDASYAQLAPYLPRASIYHCPSDRGTERIRSYAMNAYVGWVGPVQRLLQAGHRIYRHWEDLDQPGPAKLMVFIDVRPESICWPFFGITMVSDAGGQCFAFPAFQPFAPRTFSFADQSSYTIVQYPGTRARQTVKPCFL
jgi:hypothetical protein